MLAWAHNSSLDILVEGLSQGARNGRFAGARLTGDSGG